MQKLNLYTTPRTFQAALIAPTADEKKIRWEPGEIARL